MTPVEGWSQLNLVAMNMAGRFSPREIKRCGQEVIRFILNEKDIAIFFGQQTNFKPYLPRHFDFIGFTKASIIYNKKLFRACDDKMYKKFLRDMELRGKLHRHYLPETNYVVCKMQMRKSPYQEFIVISWLTDEVLGRLRSVSLFRKLMVFAADLADVEEMPILIAGTFRIPLEDAKTVLKNDCINNFRCYGYKPLTPRRSMRESDFFVCSRPLRLEDVKPLVCAKMEVEDDPGSYGRWINPEDAFYWDPVVSTLMIRPPSPPAPPTTQYPHPKWLPRGSRMQPPILTKIPTCPGGPTVVPAPLMSASAEVLKTPFTEVIPDVVPPGTPPTEETADDQNIDGHFKERTYLGMSSLTRPLGGKLTKSAGDLLEKKDKVDGLTLSRPYLNKVPSYVELYDEEQLDTNSVCYMQ